MAWELAVSVGFLVIIGILAYFSTSIPDTHFWLKILFFLGTLFFLLPLVQYTKLVASNNGADSNILGMLELTYKSLLYIIIPAVSYVMLMFIIAVFVNVKKVGDAKKNERFGGM